MGNDQVSLPPVLYHYCGSNGFKGIIESKCLWLSHAGYMNDYSESKWLFEKAKNYLDRLAADGYTEYADFMSGGHSSPPFICCFSSKPDLLSQWRAYSDDGAGFAIGFSPSKMLDKYKYLKPFLPFSRAIYDEGEQDAEIEQAIGDSHKRFQAGAENLDAIHALGRLVMLAAICKNPGFREEHEWRLVYLVSGIIRLPLQFRVNANNQLVSYCDFPFDVDTVSEIRLGPKNSAREDHEMIKSFLTANGYSSDKIEIVNSEATYR